MEAIFSILVEFSYLKPYQLISCSCVCKSWKGVIASNATWEQLYLEELNILAFNSKKPKLQTNKSNLDDFLAKFNKGEDLFPNPGSNWLDLYARVFKAELAYHFHNSRSEIMGMHNVSEKGLAVLLQVIPQNELFNLYNYPYKEIFSNSNPTSIESLFNIKQKKRKKPDDDGKIFVPPIYLEPSNLFYLAGGRYTLQQYPISVLIFNYLNPSKYARLILLYKSSRGTKVFCRLGGMDQPLSPQTKLFSVQMSDDDYDEFLDGVVQKQVEEDGEAHLEKGVNEEEESSEDEADPEVEEAKRMENVLEESQEKAPSEPENTDEENEEETGGAEGTLDEDGESDDIPEVLKKGASFLKQKTSSVFGYSLRTMRELEAHLQLSQWLKLKEKKKTTPFEAMACAFLPNFKDRRDKAVAQICNFVFSSIIDKLHEFYDNPMSPYKIYHISSELLKKRGLRAAYEYIHDPDAPYYLWGSPAILKEADAFIEQLAQNYYCNCQPQQNSWVIFPKDTNNGALIRLSLKKDFLRLSVLWQIGQYYSNLFFESAEYTYYSYSPTLSEYSDFGAHFPHISKAKMQNFNPTLYHESQATIRSLFGFKHMTLVHFWDLLWQIAGYRDLALPHLEAHTEQVYWEYKPEAYLKFLNGYCVNDTYFDFLQLQ